MKLLREHRCWQTYFGRLEVGSVGEVIDPLDETYEVDGMEKMLLMLAVAAGGVAIDYGENNPTVECQDGKIEKIPYVIHCKDCVEEVT